MHRLVLCLTMLVACASSSSPSPEPVAVSSQGDEQPTTPTANAPATDVPEVPSREVIGRTLSALRVYVAACVTSPGQRDVVSVTVEIVSDGSVRDVQLSPNFAGTAEGDCIVNVLRSAYFGPFQRETYRVNFPYRVRVEQ